MNSGKEQFFWKELQKQDVDKQDISIKKLLNVYVDTNFVISLLELHNPIVNQAAKELYNLLISTPNIKLWVLDYTIREVLDLLDAYELVKNNFFEIEVDSVFYYLKSKGYSPLRLELLKDNLIPKLNSLNIEFQETDVLLDKDLKVYSTIFDLLFAQRKKYNDKKSEKMKKTELVMEKSTHHDASVITYVLKNKDRYARNIENTKGVFLTSSFALYKYYEQNISNKFEYFPSVILDSTVTNILYLKNPKPSQSLTVIQILKAHCNYFIIDNGIWSSYLTIVKELVKQENIPYEDYTRLLNRNQIVQEALLHTDDEKINESFVLELLDKIKYQEQEKNKTIEELGNVVSKLENDKSSYDHSLKEKDLIIEANQTLYQ